MKHHRMKAAFTLVELMMAMVVLLILFLVMLIFLQKTQSVLQQSKHTTKIFENSRIAFNIIERDLHSVVRNSVQNEEIHFYVGNPNNASATAANALQCTFVASIDPNSTAAKSRLCEVSYAFHTASSSDERYELRRQVVSDDNATNWNFIGAPSSWYNNSSSGTIETFEKVVGGVDSFSIKFFDADDNQFAASTDTYAEVVKATINITLFDESLIDAPDEIRSKTKKAFTKVVYLQHIQN